jgi:hypothetical protein
LNSLRAFFFGALAGLAVATAPSCGQLKVPCGPGICDGCCLADGTCQSGSKSSDDQTCGIGGQSCVDCRGQGSACIDHACAGGTGGGSGSCGPSNCAGCCTGTTTTSVCVLPTTRNNCGASGAVCQSCSTGQVCEGGRCVALGDAGVLGRGCGDDGDCSALGTGVCKKMTASQRDDYVGGYCTKDCQVDSDCGASGVCVEVDPRFGESGRFCWSRCDSRIDCRAPDYECYSLGNNRRGCWISPLPDFDAGTPADKVGIACTQDSECSNPPDDGVCLPPTLPDGGASPFVGGYCTAPCVDASHCSTDGGATCVAIVVGGAVAGAACMHTCEAPQAGPSSCRTGYLCRGLRQADGGLAPRGVCYPSCLNQGAACPTGTTCQTSGYCQ